MIAEDAPNEAGAPPAGKMCPSTPADHASVVLGVVTSTGRIAYVTPAVQVTAPMLITLDDARRPLESRFRFAGPCVESGCGFWAGEHCGLGARVAESFADVTAVESPDGDAINLELPKCGIRSRCRWYADQGASICMACSYVVTEGRV